MAKKVRAPLRVDEEEFGKLTVEDIKSDPLLWHECEEAFYASFKMYRLQGTPPNPTTWSKISQGVPWVLFVLAMVGVAFK